MLAFIKHKPHQRRVFQYKTHHLSQHESPDCPPVFHGVHEPPNQGGVVVKMRGVRVRVQINAPVVIDT
jgi:hypothetical protein